MKNSFLAIAVLCATVTQNDAAEPPQSVPETWATFDPRAEPLETEVIREQSEEGIQLRQIRYVVGTFGGKKMRVAAFYALPKGGKNLPAIVQLHGGGQRAQAETAKFWASHGYAAAAVNWGEKTIGQPGDPGTDWAGIAAGFLDPKHHNDVSPRENTLFEVPHPWNSSWLLYSAAARRAMTFLEKQPEVDGSRIGLTGHSMGGRLTVLTAIDPRVKAATPSVGGSGYLYEDIWGVPGSARRMQADRQLYLKTLDCSHYWPLIRCPVMFLGATNDFNSPMEKVIRGMRSLRQGPNAMSFAPHQNHRFSDDTFAARVRWFDAHLKGEFKFPRMAASRLELKTDRGIPRFVVRPDTDVPYPLKSVAVYYGYARDPRTRFWRSADVTREGGQYVANCPVAERDEPLFVFANATYDTGKRLQLPRGYRATSLLTVTGQCRQAAPHQLKEAGVKAVLKRQRLIDDFAHGWRDWFPVAAENAHHWQFKTHKVNDPAYVGPRGAKLALGIETTAPGNTLAVTLDADEWRGYTGRKPTSYTALVVLAEAGKHAVELPCSAFLSPEGKPLSSYDRLSGMVLSSGHKARPEQVKTPWQGEVPTFEKLHWVSGDFAPRPKPYLGNRNDAVDADAAFREQFEKAVEESVERERLDDK